MRASNLTAPTIILSAIHEPKADYPIFGSDLDFARLKPHIRFPPESGHSPDRAACPFCADFVVEVGDDSRVAAGTTFLISRLPSAP